VPGTCSDRCASFVGIGVSSDVRFCPIKSCIDLFSRRQGALVSGNADARMHALRSCSCSCSAVPGQGTPADTVCREHSAARNAAHRLGAVWRVWARGWLIGFCGHSATMHRRAAWPGTHSGVGRVTCEQPRVHKSLRRDLPDLEVAAGRLSIKLDVVHGSTRRAETRWRSHRASLASGEGIYLPAIILCPVQLGLELRCHPA
jgi:hypothetical protein